MKTFLLILPVVLSLVVAAAHFLRMNSMILALTLIFLPFILFIKHRFTSYIMKGTLLLVTLEWIRTLYVLYHQRLEADQPASRMALILGGVALFTLLSACAFSTKTMKNRY